MDGRAVRYAPRVGFTDLQINIFLKILFNLFAPHPPPPQHRRRLHLLLSLYRSVFAPRVPNTFLTTVFEIFCRLGDLFFLLCQPF